MALIFGDSFDHYFAADILKKWTSAGATVTATTISSDDGIRPSSKALRFAGTGATAYYAKSLPAGYATFICGFYFKTNNFTTARPIVQFLETGTEHVSVRFDTSGRITFTRNATVLATSANSMSADTWYHIEIKATIGDAGDTPSGRYQVRVNGTATNWIADSGTGQDTRNGGTQNVNEVRLSHLQNSSSTFHYYDDFYFLDTTGAVAADFLGPVRFAVLAPAAVGSSAQWTGNYADNFVNVQDREGDGDATFNQSSTANNIDLFTMSDVPAGTVYAVQHVLMARQDAGAQRVIRPKTRISSTNYNGTSINTGSGYTFHTQAVTLSPATSAQWTDSEVNGSEFGYELVS